MENFIAYNPTTLHFGKGILDGLGKTAATAGKKALLVYGKQSIKKNGLYDKITSQLRIAGIDFVEYSGIKSNPIVEDVDAAAEVGRQNSVDFVLAVGGGSVVDSAKIISIAIPATHRAWDFYEGKVKPQTALPLIAVLTLAATGTEMNPFAVLQNHETGQKLGYTCKLTYPKHSFLDPEVTYSVPADYTGNGISDLTAHCLEIFFGAGDCTLSDRFVFAIIGDAMEWAPKLMANLQDYDSRAAIMYDATMALNLITANGKKSGGDWGVHALGHIISLLYDVPHGASLSIMFPAWMKLHKDRCPERIVKLGQNLFNTSDTDTTIGKFEAFFSSVGSPVRLSQAGIGADKHEELLSYWIKNNAQGNDFKLSEADYKQLLAFAK